MVGTDANLVFCADHAARLVAAQLGLLDGDAVVAVIELRADGGNDDLLSGCHVGCSADNLHGVSLTEADRGDVHVVGIGVRLARHHFADDQSFQSAFYGLDFLHAAHFQAYGCQCVGKFLRAEVEVYVLLQPVIRYVHIANIYRLRVSEPAKVVTIFRFVCNFRTFAAQRSHRVWL